jgi:hypothetical protein
MSVLNRCRLTRKRLALVFGLFVVVVGLLYTFTHTRWGLGIAYQVSRGTRYEEQVLRRQLALYGDPLERSLLNGQFQAGDPIESVKAMYGPHRELILGRYTIISPPMVGPHCDGCVFVAKDGRLCAALWNVDHYGRFRVIDTLTQEEWDEITALDKEYWQRRLAGWRDAHMAVAGFAAVDDPWVLASDSPEERAPDE